MPFTLSHPIAILPFRRLGILSALVVGSLSPDFSRFLPGAHKSVYSHTFIGTFLFCLPASLICLALFHQLLKLPLISLAPLSLQPALLNVSPDFAFGGIGRAVQIIGSIIFGTFTHIAWDSFTHQEGWGVQRFAWMRQEFHPFPHYNISLAMVLQDLSTVAGLVLLLFLMFQWAKHNFDPTYIGDPLAVPRYRISLTVVMLGIAALPGLIRFAQDSEHWLLHERREFLGGFAITMMSVLILELLVYSVVWHFSRNRRLSTVEQVDAT